MKTSLIVLCLFISANAMRLTDDHNCPGEKPKLSDEASAAVIKAEAIAKKVDNDREILQANKRAREAEKNEASKQIKEALEGEGMSNEKKAMENAVNVVENIRKQKSAVHDEALKRIEKNKEEA